MVMDPLEELSRFGFLRRYVKHPRTSAEKRNRRADNRRKKKLEKQSRKKNRR